MRNLVRLGVALKRTSKDHFFFEKPRLILNSNTFMYGHHVGKKCTEKIILYNAFEHFGVWKC